MTKLNEFLTKQKIDPRRVLLASRKVESARPEDREIRRARRAVKMGEKPSDAMKAMAEKKPRSGKPVTPPTLDKALVGKPLSGAAKTRIARAVNQILADKKKGEVAVSDLF